MKRETFWDVLIVGLAVALIFLVGFLFGGQVFAQVVQKFNPIEGRWETTYENSEIRITPDGKSQYVTPRHQERDRSEERQEYREPAAREVQPSFNVYEGKWEFPR